MKEFCNLNGPKNLINKLKCLNNSEKSTCIDLILTNRPTYFQYSTVLEAGLSNYYLLTVTEFKMRFQKRKRHITEEYTYWDYKKYNNDAFRSVSQSVCSNDKDVCIFKYSILYAFNKHASIRKKNVQKTPRCYYEEIKTPEQVFKRQKSFKYRKL